MRGRRRCCRPPGLQDALPLPGRVEAPTSPAAPAPATAAPLARPGQPRRILALHLPWLATERLRLPPDRPAACWATTGSRRLLTAVTPAAAAAGLQPGQPVADAQAILPGLPLHPAAPEEDAAWLHGLALWSLGLTPLPATDPPDGLLLDVTGLAHLHGGEAALLQDIAARFARRGVTVRAALAGGAVAAAALARSEAAAIVPPAEEAPARIVPPGAEEAALAPLPLAALRLDPRMVAALHRMGIRRIGDAWRLPRGPLARRFGAALLDRLDAAAGRRDAPIAPVRPPPEFRAGREFLEPIATREAIDATLALLLEELCARLAAAGRGARRLALLAFRVDGQVQEAVVGSGLPQRDPAHFARLFRERLERLAPGFGFERLVLEAPVTEPLAAAQATLPGRDGGGLAAEARRQALAQLLDRLGQRLPVWRLAPCLSHWPERTVARIGAFDPVAVPEGWPGRAPRPLRLLRRPVPLAAMAALPDDPPSLLRPLAPPGVLPGAPHGSRQAWRVLRAEGPERLAPEWWREARPDRPFRDYYRVELAGGARLWVCRAGFATAEGGPARWWLHGRFG